MKTIVFVNDVFYNFLNSNALQGCHLNWIRVCNMIV